MRIRALLLLGVVLLTTGCGLRLPADGDDDVHPPWPECRAERYLFTGRATFADLGLVGQSLAPLPDPERPAMIWVTEDRMLCFEFDDGSGGTEWPIDEAWLPPSARGAAAADTTGPIPQLIALGAVTVGIVAVSLLAFRRRQ